MNKFVRYFLIFGLVFGFSKSYSKELNTNNYQEGVILVKFKASVSETQIQKLNHKFHTDYIILIPELKLYKIKLPKQLTVEDAIKSFSSSDLIEYAEPDYKMKIQKASKKESKNKYFFEECNER